MWPISPHFLLLAGGAGAPPVLFVFVFVVVSSEFWTGEVLCALSAVGPYLFVQIPLPFEGETTGLDEWWQLAGDWRPTATVQHCERFSTAVAVLLQCHYTRMSGRENEVLVLLEVWDAPKVYTKVTGPVVHRHHRLPTLCPYQLCHMTTSTTSSRELTKVRRYLCLNRPKHQSGANFVWPTSMKDIRTVRCSPVSTRQARYCSKIDIHEYCTLQY